MGALSLAIVAIWDFERFIYILKLSSMLEEKQSINLGVIAKPTLSDQGCDQGLAIFLHRPVKTNLLLLSETDPRKKNLSCRNNNASILKTYMSVILSY